MPDCHAISQPGITKRPDLGPLVEFDYRPRGDEDNWDLVYGYMTEDIDAWGKRTVYVLLADGSLEAWYLFEHEYEVLGEVLAP